MLSSLFMPSAAPSAAEASVAGSPAEPLLPPPVKLSTPEAYLHLFKANLGPGILALPFAFAYATNAAALPTTAAVILQGTYGILLQVLIEKKIRPDHSDLNTTLHTHEFAQTAFGKPGRIAASVSVALLQLGICAVYIGLVAENMQTFTSLSRLVCVLIAYLPCALLTLLPNLNSISPLSIFGNVVMLAAIMSTFVVSIIVLAGNDSNSVSSIVSLGQDDVHAASKASSCILHITKGSFASVVACLTQAFYAFEGIAVVLPICSQLSERAEREYPRTVFIAVGIVGVAFLVLGGISSAAFPLVDKANILIYLQNMYTTNSLVGRLFLALNISLTASCIATFPLQFTPVAHVFSDVCTLPVSPRLVHLFAVSACALFVACVPGLDLLIQFVGALTNTTIAALPCAVHARLLLTSEKVGPSQPVINVSPGGPHVSDAIFPRQSLWRAILLIIDFGIIAFCLTVGLVGVIQTILSAASTSCKNTV